MSQIREDLVRLLGDGHSQLAVSQALGLSESRLSQMLADEPELREAIAAKKLASMQQLHDLDDARLGLERKILDKLEKAIPMMALARPMEIARVYQIINGAKQHAGTAAPERAQAGVQVTVVLPQAIMSRFQVNQRNEVIELNEGVPFITASPSKLIEAQKVGASQKELSNDSGTVTGKRELERPIKIPTSGARLETLSADSI